MRPNPECSDGCVYGPAGAQNCAYLGARNNSEGDGSVLAAHVPLSRKRVHRHQVRSVVKLSKSDTSVYTAMGGLLRIQGSELRTLHHDQVVPSVRTGRQP